MCGLFGWATSRPLGSDTPFDAALGALAHRGPDGEGRWRAITPGGREIALGHRRLAVLDAEGGAQPMRSHDGRFVVVLNGEIYNYVELRGQLRARGCRFLTLSDTEVLIEAWRTWGADALTRVQGAFAFALYDSTTGDLTLARDPFGKKPLFLTAAGPALAFASEIEALLTFPDVESVLNTARLPDYLLHRYVPGPDTLFKGVRKAPPGTLLRISSCGDVVEQRYFDSPLLNGPTAATPAHEVERTFAEALEQAVRIRLRADSPCGVFLSGGLDSSVLAALAARESPGRLQTFSAGAGAHGSSELAPAQRTAEQLGADHCEIDISPGRFGALWERAARRRGAPVSEASDIALLMLAEAAAGSVKVVLTGEGADELLGGYPKHRAERWARAFHAAVPKAVQARLLAPLLAQPAGGCSRLSALARAGVEPDADQRAAAWFATGTADQVAALVGRPPAPVPAADGSLSDLRRLQLFDQRAWLPDNLLERGDRMTMAAGVEGRAPFMDRRLAVLCARFPEGHLTGGRGGKRVLRRYARGLLDADTLRRPKSGFRIPIDEWFRGPLKGHVDDLLRSTDARVRRLVDPAALDAVLDGPGERPGGGGLLWALTNLEVFLRVYNLGP